MPNAIITTHQLDFMATPSPYNFLGCNQILFKIGTTEGVYGNTSDSYYILAVKNTVKGNGHLNDVFEWFEYAAKRDNKNLLVLECFNKDFYNHLLQKRGFVALDKKNENCIKIFNQQLYQQLLKNGNEILKKRTLTCV